MNQLMATLTLASDYDGTLAEHGHVEAETATALRRFREAGHRLVMVTGRETDDLISIFPEYGLFESIVAENGALLYTPATRHETMLTEPLPTEFLDELRKRGVAPLYVGKVLIATFASYRSAIEEVMAQRNLQLRLIYNKESVMILPQGVDKRSGLRAALTQLGGTANTTIAVGDAENDFDLLAGADMGVAVANAIPELKAQADWVTTRPAGKGVVELIDHLLAGTFPATLPGDRLLTRS